MTEPASARRGPRIWPVSRVNRAVRLLLEEAVQPFWVGGEVSGWTRARSGHCYFTLKDDRAQLRSVMWRSEAERLPTDPDEGMEVQAFGQLTLYEARGEYQLVVRRLRSGSEEGLWRLALERLRKKLEAEGLLADERKRPLPPVPARVGVITSLEGAAIRDILVGLRERAPWTHVILRGARVQGEGAAAEIARALRALGSWVDVIIVGRGGGSLEDLWAFNEETVVRAIAECPVPVVSAVGHETDVTLSDLVADVRAPTPTAAARIAVPGADRMVSLIEGAGARLARALKERGAAEREHLERLRSDGALALERLLERERERVARLAGQLHALSPLATLSRGYAVAEDLHGSLLRGTSGFSPGRPFRLRVSDGQVEATADRIEATAS